MSEKINWKLDVQVIGGPKMSGSTTIAVDAYDVINVEVPGGEVSSPGAATVEVQPGGAGQVQFLLIAASQYSEKLTYSVDGAGGASNVELDAQQMLAGKGAVGLLGAAPAKLDFSNALGANKDVSVTILVGRKATT